MRERIYRFLEPAPGRGLRREQLFDVVLVILIVASVATVLLRTVPSVADSYGSYLEGFQLAATVVFTVEYLLRIYACTADERYTRPLTGRLRFLVTPMALVDLMAVLPFYLVPLLAPGSNLAGAMLTLRTLRLLKLFRYSSSMTVFVRVLREKGDQLAAALLMTALLLVLSSSLVYFAERGAQPEAFSSIPETMWWGVITLTTVGYGDVSPVTPLGQFFGAVTALTGIGLVALPSGILASGFLDAFAGRRTQSQTPPAQADHPAGESRCPRCGHPLA